MSTSQDPEAMDQVVPEEDLEQIAGGAGLEPHNSQSIYGVDVSQRYSRGNGGAGGNGGNGGAG